MEASLIAHRQQFGTFKDLNSWAKSFSIYTWNRLNFSFKTKLKYGEREITQELLFEFWILAKSLENQIWMFESIKESANGNDIEFFVKVAEDRYIFFPIQAKRVYENGKYDKINHANRTWSQNKSLIDYGEKNFGIPLYLFFNAVDKDKEVFDLEKKLGYPIESLGCSFVDAYFIRKNYVKKKIPSFIEIHNQYIIPFTMLFEVFQTNDLISQFQNKNYKFKYYTLEGIRNNKMWKPIVDVQFPSIGKTSNSSNLKNILGEFNRNDDTFSPAYRIVINQKINWVNLLAKAIQPFSTSKKKRK